MRRLNRIFLFLLLALGVAGVSAAPRDAAAEDAYVDVSVFYDALEPHGTWLHLRPYGWVWQPANVDVTWRPYVDGGTWIWLEGYGWTWFSEYEWGWAPFHYGRWFFHPSYGWLWQPGSMWAPAWVAWRLGPGWAGWMPLPPEVGYRDTLVWSSVDVTSPSYLYWWSFVPMRSFTDTRLASHVIPFGWNSTLLSRTRDTTRFVTGDSRFVVNRSFEPAEIERAGARVDRRKLREAPSATPSKKEGDAVVLFRPRVKEGEPARAPKAAPRPDAKALADRRARFERMLEEQQKALDAKAPEGIPAEEVERSREERRAAFEAHKKRALEEARRVEEQPEAPVAPSAPGRPDQPGRPAPEGRPPEPPPGRPATPPEERPGPPDQPPGQPKPPPQPPKEKPQPPKEPPGMGGDDKKPDDGGMGGEDKQKPDDEGEEEDDTPDKDKEKDKDKKKD